MIYYIADTHFGHANIIKLDGRPFKTVEEMDKVLIQFWNNKVQDTDDVWIIGDFAFRNAESVAFYAKQLRGRKHLIMGNHDKLTPEDKKYFVSIDTLRTISDNGRKIVLCHYPLAEWDGFFRGVYHIYAHIHNNTNEAYYNMKTKERALNAGCMINMYQPVTLEELIINNKKFKEAH
jgi:calcineurin-like phosphoesterase family protein